MAELSSKALANFTAASSALILTDSLRLIRNYRYYNNLSDDRIYSVELVKKAREARKLAYILQNLISKDEPDEAPFFVSVAGLVNDLLEEIHRKLLFFQSDDIIDIIPKVDQQRRFWSDFNQSHFYDADLVKALDHSVPQALLKIERKIEHLPEYVSL